MRHFTKYLQLAAHNTCLFRALTAGGEETEEAILATAESAGASSGVVRPAAAAGPPPPPPTGLLLGGCWEEDAATANAGDPTLGRTSSRLGTEPRPPLDEGLRRPVLLLPLPPSRAPCRGGCAIDK